MWKRERLRGSFRSAWILGDGIWTKLVEYEKRREREEERERERARSWTGAWVTR